MDQNQSTARDADVPAGTPPTDRFERVNEPRPPRVWPTLVVTGSVLPAMLLVQIVVVLVMLIIGMLTGQVTDDVDIIDWLEDVFANNLVIFVILLLLFQLLFLALAVVPAMLSPQPFYRRLNMVRCEWSWMTWPLLALATLFIMQCSSLISGLIFEQPSPALEEFVRSITDASLPWFLVLLAIISIAPAIAEELLFRGYIQTRLLQRWSPWLAIGVTSIVFAIMHMDLQHVVGVLPIGVWLGIMAWRTGSIWPCVFCHFINNAFAVLIVRFAENNTLPDLVNVMTLVIFIAGGLALALSVVLFIRSGHRAPPASHR